MDLMYMAHTNFRPIEGSGSMRALLLLMLLLLLLLLLLLVVVVVVRA
jgi:hypothetical protein